MRAQDASTLGQDMLDAYTAVQQREQELREAVSHYEAAKAQYIEAQYGAPSSPTP